jgi:hypothetical protein
VQHLEMIIVYILHFISLRFDKFRKSYAWNSIEVNTCPRHHS